MAGGANSQTHNLINLLNSKKMKTTYLKPTIDVLYISVEQMIAASGPVGPKSTDNHDLSTAPTTDQTSGNLSRRRDIWADPEEDEEERF